MKKRTLIVVSVLAAVVGLYGCGAEGKVIEQNVKVMKEAVQVLKTLQDTDSAMVVLPQIEKLAAGYLKSKQGVENLRNSESENTKKLWKNFETDWLKTRAELDSEIQRIKRLGDVMQVAGPSILKFE